MDALSRFVAIFLCIALLFTVTMIGTVSIQKDAVNDRAKELTKEFVSEICTSKKLTLDALEDYSWKLSQLGNLYEIRIDSGCLVEEKQETKIMPKIVFLSYVQEVDTETEHIHDERCYFGTEHICSAYGGSCYTYDTKFVPHSHNDSCYSIHSHTWSTYWQDESCYENRECGDNIWVDRHYQYGRCTSCGKSYTIQGYATCTGCGNYYSAGPYSAPAPDKTLTCTKGSGTWEGYYYKSCGKISGHYYYNGSDETYLPKCHQVVVDLQPIVKHQNVKIGNDFDNRCIATYLDGHQEIILCPNNYQKQLGTQTVTLTYNGLLYTAKNSGILTVEVGTQTKEYYTCPNCGKDYEADENGNDPGCPICGNKIIGMRVELEKNLYHIGEDLLIKVYLQSTNGEEELLTGWETNYNAYLVGQQNVTVKYLDMESMVTVTVSDKISTCPDCGTDYEEDTCPNCSKTITGITAYVTWNEIEVGGDPGFYIKVAYQDGRQEYFDSGFRIAGFQKYMPGLQKVEITYSGFKDTVSVTVLDNGRQYTTCLNGHRYPLNADGSDPGCPYCLDQKDRNYQYLQMTYTGEILDKLEQTGSIEFSSGEFITVTILCKGSIWKKLSLIKQEERITCGGQIH